MTTADHQASSTADPFTVRDQPELFVPLLRLLADGEPVTVAELAAVPDTEYDDEGGGDADSRRSGGPE